MVAFQGHVPWKGPTPDSPGLSNRDRAPRVVERTQAEQTRLHPSDTTAPGGVCGLGPPMAPSAGFTQLPAQPAADRGHLSSLRRFIWGGER